MDGEQFGRLQPLPAGSIGHPVAHEIGQHNVIGMLQLASAAGGEVATGRRNVVRPRSDSPFGIDIVPRHGSGNMAARGGHAVALGGEADNGF